MPRKRAPRLPRPTNPPQVYEVEWLDAGVETSYDNPDISMFTMLTVGYYIRKLVGSKSRRLEVHLASDKEPGKDGALEFRTIHVIPAIHVVRMTSLQALPDQQAVGG